MAGAQADRRLARSPDSFGVSKASELRPLCEAHHEDGKSPMCDSYETRLAELIDSLTPRESSQSIANPHGLLEQGAN